MARVRRKGKDEERAGKGESWKREEQGVWVRRERKGLGRGIVRW